MKSPSARVADVIRENGWAQRDFRSPDGCLCLMGAIYVAAGGAIRTSDEVYGDTGWSSWPSIVDAAHMSTYFDILEDVYVRLPKTYRWFADGVPMTKPNAILNYNDAPSRTASEVLAMLDGDPTPNA